MVIIRDIVSDFSDEKDIELCCDDDDNVDIASVEPNYVDYIVVESRPDRYVGQCKYFGRNLWEIRKISGRHTCVSTCISQDHTKLSSSFIASCIIQLVSEDPGIPIKALVKEVVTRFGYTVTYRKAWTAKQIAMSHEDDSNLPGTIVRYATSRHEDDSTLFLDRVFWAFKPCIEGLEFCKPILQVDRTFLTRKYCGTLLIVSLQDGNRRVFPDAFAIIEGETKEAWEWFFYNLRTFVTPQPNICIISVRETSLLGALRTELPQWCNAQSVYCIRHVASNFNKEFKDTDLKEKVVEMGYELVRPHFEGMLSALRQKILEQLLGRRYGHMTTNLAECVNGVLKVSRALPITALVRATYCRLNSWFVHCRDEASSMVRAGHIYCEELTKVINENNHKATCQFVRNFSRESEVSEVEVAARDGSRHSKVYIVRLMQNWCDCDYGQFISPIYRLDNILKVYGHEFQPIRIPTFIPNPLMRRNQSGRPKTTRIHNEMDDSPSEQNKKCGWCWTEYHNRKTCPFRNT
ncbi:hypothetical protein Lal_00041065 [Lupinus albus]|nr:hypothetical protein Lal_00041065 [Lupinus albus]